MRYAMILDRRKCFGCNGCTVACKQANATPPGTFYTRVLLEESGKFPNSKQSFMPMICNHCDKAPCVAVCPTKASKKMPDGTVQITSSECIGCQLCMEACPYGARFFNGDEKPTYWEEKGQNEFEKARSKDHVYGTVDKCTFCKSRRDRGMIPACVETCPAVARVFGDLDDPNSEVSKLYKKYQPKPYKPEKGTHPRVFYIG
ncbi:4Fe-4S dicluster domain-containing protein [Seleniivibrio woodruffii]|uniref:Molybdopterin-containing oxidoreductase family iron-sulfur binding subunit n=1 Tax=Seleniivibrio woodruffii TaxID=1078050 RepID=A0A4R1K330_9BACT|nr:4Fe-4S dicluster domain-containing protein [Seleniivibrio woodruffii]TCK58468.1 molybdopterin-containing oxidoreductase family iron-sulfur binding subunit [Seleniivibrio woodruffii]TVZ36841.1 molybdopterin-containing oxidoreductase family iron-sulfur binding subunit [Seleniivibrio woodruffii]